jgi:quinol monooxygenase YgiN
MERRMETEQRIVRIAELDIDPAQLDAYKALLAEEIEASVRLETGVLMLHAVALSEAPEKIRLLEVYADENAYQAHLATPHFQKYKMLTAFMVRALRLVPVTPILMSAK